MSSAGVRAAVTTLGTGYLRHPANERLRADLDVPAFHRSLLRLAYRLIFRSLAPSAAFPHDDELRDLALGGEDLSAAVRHLSGVRGAELGATYEAQLELVPRVVDRTFQLVSLPGHDRRTSGSYYTPAPLIDCLLDTVLEPVLARATSPGALMSVTVCDPACGAGNLLVAAARRIAARMAALGARPDLPAIVARCLYGVDLDPMAVELATVSLWLECGSPSTPLNFLNGHLRAGNALTTFDWSVFPRFDCVVGNPPWERIKLQEQEFFARRDVTIAGAPSAARRKELIAALKQDPARQRLNEEYLAAKQKADSESHYLRTSGRYPLTGRGDINTYAVFAEAGLSLLAGTGRMGLIVPTGIATDATTRFFFNDLVSRGSLTALYDFENRAGLFPAVDSRMRFAILAVAGDAIREPSARFAFFLRDPSELDHAAFTLTPAEIRLLNPNTGTCPVFRSRRDASLTIGIYQRVPVLVGAENPWGLSFRRLFDMTNDSHLFRSGPSLSAAGWSLRGNVFESPEGRMLPLYQGMMAGLYDHRAASVERSPTAATRLSRPRPTTPAEHADPHFLPMPAAWVDERHLPPLRRDWLIAFSSITAPTNERSFVPYVLPRAAVGNSAPVIDVDVSPTLAAALIANLGSFVVDYVARTKLGGTNLNYFHVNQFPVLSPSMLAPHAGFIVPRVLELTYTSHDMAPFARDLGFSGAPYRWDADRRALLRAELDALFFRLYGLDRDDIVHVMDTFPIVRRKDIATHGTYRTADLILASYG